MLPGSVQRDEREVGQAGSRKHAGPCTSAGEQPAHRPRWPLGPRFGGEAVPCPAQPAGRYGFAADHAASNLVHPCEAPSPNLTKASQVSESVTLFLTRYQSDFSLLFFIRGILLTRILVGTDNFKGYVRDFCCFFSCSITKPLHTIKNTLWWRVYPRAVSSGRKAEGNQ